MNKFAKKIGWVVVLVTIIAIGTLFYFNMFMYAYGLMFVLLAGLMFAGEVCMMLSQVFAADSQLYLSKTARTEGRRKVYPG
ncbi:hypothetical protein [Paenibacillus sp. MSJ-34]|uniref:hypothetical protein n=1 Tax=Paenibacillus sp. MSJ-34 TaxID=2841529 RepID=UPI001C12267F|nr:hypothetical protein [Paenibacillus sp. MSJ-34]MBU5440478.1 hypothetical protein [Paenibacillus sp. MSJ-34]